MRGEVEAVAAQFGRNLAEARNWEGLTQKQLGARVSMTQRHIAGLEGGQRCPRLDSVVRLAEAVGVQVRDLLYGIE